MCTRVLTTAAPEQEVYTHVSPRAPGSYPCSPARQRRLVLRAGLGDGQPASRGRGGATLGSGHLCVKPPPLGLIVRQSWT
jgi:hypothetical protein